MSLSSLFQSQMFWVIVAVITATVFLALCAMAPRNSKNCGSGCSCGHRHEQDDDDQPRGQHG